LALALAALASLGPGQARAYDIVNRWSATQVNGGNLQRGDAVTLRWSIVPDGQSYSRSANSQLIQFLDDAWNVPAPQRTPIFINRPWFTVINRAYQQFGRVSGVNMVYVAEQTATGVDTGNEGDIRIGGENLDGTPGGALADNTFPNDGDMRIDTTREANGAIGFYFSTEPGLRNLIIHESGHGVGLGHAQFVNNSAKAVMEGGLRTDIWGLQFDDIYALNRQYGDPFERGNANNTVNTPTALGAIAMGSTLSIGRDAADSVVDEVDDEWVGIDGTTDADWFRFSVEGQGFANIKLTPVGPTYETVQQGVFNAARQNDLEFQVFKTAPNLSQIGTAARNGVGTPEAIPAQLLSTAGDYLIRVLGRQDANQFYQLDLSFSELPAAGISADINLDGFTNSGDWTLFSANAYTDLSAVTIQKERFQHGDLDLDGDNDFADFRFFKQAYIGVNGAAAFASLLAVPEPQSLVLALGAAVGLGSRPRRRSTACK
jgi:hypothetical protein